MRKNVILLIILLIVLIGLLAAVLGPGNELECAIGRLLYDFGLTQTAPRCVAGTQVAVEGCDGLEVSDQIQQPLCEAIVEWMPRLYDEFRGGCLADLECPFDGCTTEAIRNALTDLATSEPLEIVCTSSTDICFGPEVKGHVIGPDLRADRLRIHICRENVESFANGAFLIAHEMTHLAVNQVADWHAASQEPYPTAVGRACGIRLQ